MSSLAEEALALFHAGCSRTVAWDEFTGRQKDHWLAVAREARLFAVAALEDAAYAAQSDELATAAEVIYDLRARAKDLRLSTL